MNTSFCKFNVKTIRHKNGFDAKFSKWLITQLDPFFSILRKKMLRDLLCFHLSHHCHVKNVLFKNYFSVIISRK